MKYHLLEIWIF